MDCFNRPILPGTAGSPKVLHLEHSALTTLVLSMLLQTAQGKSNLKAAFFFFFFLLLANIYILAGRSKMDSFILETLTMIRFQFWKWASE